MMDQELLARLRYPFPTLVNPHAAAIQEHTNRDWIDGELAGCVPHEVAERFKNVRTGYMTSYFYPMATWERLVPLARMMLFSLYQDDIYERASPDQARHLRRRTIAVARGQLTAAEADVMLAAQIETLRGELLRFIPAESVARWAADLDRYYAGLVAETLLVTTGAYPDVAEYQAMREDTLMVHAFLALIEVETGVVLPAEIHDHPVVRRLKSLAVRVVAWFNEFQSYDKDMCTGMANVNLINVIAHEYRVSLAEARERAFQIHASELAEFVRLQAALPDFGHWHDAVANHIHHMSFVISGWRGVDAVIQRYDPEHYLNETVLAAAARDAPGYRRPGNGSETGDG